MEFKNIEVGIDFSELLESDINKLQSCDLLIEHFNSVKPSQYPYNKFSYNGDNFKTEVFGYLHLFLLGELEEVLKNDSESHKSYILNYIKESLKEFDIESRFRNISSINIKTDLKNIINYYSLSSDVNFPSYFKSQDFKDFIEALDTEINNLF